MVSGFYYRVNEIVSKVPKEEFYGALEKDMLYYVGIMRVELKSEKSGVKYLPDLSKKSVDAVKSVMSILCDYMYSSEMDLNGEEFYMSHELRVILRKSDVYKSLMGLPAIRERYHKNCYIGLEEAIVGCFYGFINKYFSMLDVDFPCVRTFKELKDAMYDYGFSYHEVSGDYTTDGKPDGCFYSSTPDEERHYVITVNPLEDGYHAALDIVPLLKAYNRYVCNRLVCWDKLFPRDYSNFIEDMKGISKPTTRVIYRCDIPQ